MSYERINEDPQFDGEVRNSHEARYHIASGFVCGGDRVVDFGCGVGYGKPILIKERRNVSYFGLDAKPVDDDFWYCDLEKSEDLEKVVPKHFDVSVCFEVIEHLNELDELIKHMKRANKWVVVSTPIIPTKHRNPFHVRDFTSDQVIELFSDENWELFQWFKQKEVYGIFVFKRK